MRRPPLASVLLPALATALLAQSPRSSWTLTLDERIALRTDPEIAQQRVKKNDVSALTAQQKQTRAPQNLVDSFDGKQHPELFLPHEVFDELVRLAFLGSPRQCQIVQEGFTQDVKRYGLPPDFWKRLQSMSAIYVLDMASVHDIGAGMQHQVGRRRERAEETLALKNADVCRSRADALKSARNEFGRERFDRFLYEVIAHNMFYIADRLPDATILRAAEGGCR